MPAGIRLGRGVERLISNRLKFVRTGHPVYLRVRNFPDVQNQLWAQMGFQIAPSGASPVGTSDILIVPQPAVSMISIHNIGQSMGKLRFGARQFVISGDFVDQMKQVQALANQDLVWRQANVVGLFTEKLLFSIEDIQHREIGGKTVCWKLVCNNSELG